MVVEQTRLVGRDSELSRLVEALDAAGRGRPRVVLVTGEPGIGKTRLVQEVVDLAEQAGFLVATGQCSPATGTRLPFGPVVELLADLDRVEPDLAGVVPAEAWRAVELLTGVPDARGAVVPEASLGSTRVFSGVLEAIGAASARRPCLLVVEDLHWSDAATLDLLAFLARKLRRQRVVLLLTHRPAETLSRSQVRTVLAELIRLQQTEVVSVGPLGAQRLRELLASLPDPPAPDRVGSIAERSEGIPFFALHLAGQRAGDPVPAALRDVLSASLETITPAQRQLLVLLAVSREGDDLPLLVESGALSGAEVSEQVRGLVERGLLAVRRGRVGFRHALVREVVVDDTLPTERVLAHARMAEALLASSAQHRTDRSGQLAHHLLECGRDEDAIRYAVAAAHAATATWAFSDARDLYAAVRRVWPRVAEPQVAAGASATVLLTEAAMTARWCGDLEGALTSLDEAARQPAAPPAELAAVEHARGQVLWAAGRMQESADAYARAVDLMPDATDEVLRCGLLAALAHGLMATGRAMEARETASRAATLAGELGADRVRVHAAITASAAHAQLGDVQTALDGLRRNLPEARRLDDVELVVRCYGNLAYALGIGCRYEELASVTAEGIEVCSRYGPVLSIASTLMTNQVNALVTLGRWDEALEVARVALATVTSRTVAVHLRVAVAEVAVARGDLETADEHLERSVEAGLDNPYTSSAVSVVRTERALWAGDPDAAVEHVTRALDVLLGQDDALPVLEACWLGLRAAADLVEGRTPSRRAQGADALHPGAAATLLDQAGRAARRTSLPVARATMLACVAEDSRLRGVDDADSWEAAAAANHELGRPYVRAYCLMRLGAVHLHRHARVAAGPPLHEGLRLAEGLGAVPLVGAIELLLTVGGLHPEEPPRAARGRAAAPFALTPRELEVLRLLTTGSSNRVVARALFISERTASVHVSNILGKLGVANRTEAARTALSLGLDRSVPPEETA